MSNNNVKDWKEVDRLKGCPRLPFSSKTASKCVILFTIQRRVLKAGRTHYGTTERLHALTLRHAACRRLGTPSTTTTRPTTPGASVRSHPC